MNDKPLNCSCSKCDVGRGSTSHVLLTAPRLLLLRGPPKGVWTDGSGEFLEAACPVLSQLSKGIQAILEMKTAVKGLGFILANISQIQGKYIS